MISSRMRSNFTFKFTCVFQLAVLSVFFVVPSGFVHAQSFSVISLPKPGTMVTVSEKFVPLQLKGISLHKENPLVFDFIVDPGDSNVSIEQARNEAQKLFKYFFAALTVPDKDLWVNLSPYEKDRIIPEAFSKTEMGRDLLAQDYILKQLSASLIYPEKDLGRDFWSRVYRKAKEVYGTTDIPVNTFNKVWIVPQKAVFVETDSSAFIVKSSLKVMLEEDYIALNKNRANEVLGTEHLEEKDINNVSRVTSAIVRDIVLPEIEREVNEGKNFTQLRQIYSAILLATWFKANLRDNIINQIYSNQSKILGIDLQDKTDKEKIYSQYLEAFREGVFNYIKEDVDESTKDLIPRKYFSGGAGFEESGKLARDGDDIQGGTPVGDRAIADATRNGAFQFVVAADRLLSEQKKQLEIIAQRISATSDELAKGEIQKQAGLALVWLQERGTADALSGLNQLREFFESQPFISEAGGVVSKSENLELRPVKVAIAAIEGRMFKPRKDALATYLKPVGETTSSVEGNLKIRRINLSGLYTLSSVYSEQSQTTIHELAGYGITPLVSEAFQGDETQRNWKEVVSMLEDDFSSKGTPYRDGVIPGNSYYERMLNSAVQMQIESYARAGESIKAESFDEYAKAVDYLKNLGKEMPAITAIQTIDTLGKTTFGMALVSESDGALRIVVESGFLDMVKQKGNPYDMLTRAFIYLLNRGTHEENRIAEYEYARSRNRNISKELRIDVEQVFQNLVNDNLTKEAGRDEQMAREWTRKVKESLWEIGVHMMNGDMNGQKKVLPRIRWSEKDSEFTVSDDTGDVRIGLFASALNPLHFGQFEPVLRAMAQLKLDQVGVVNHAFDYRKQGKGLNPTFQERNEMAQEWVKQFGGLLVLAKVLDGSEADGETKFRRVIELNGNRKGSTTFVYTAVGGDHMHLYAPGTKDSEGNKHPKTNNRGEFQEDTVTKIDNMRREMNDFMLKNKMSIILAFNFRELFESLPMDEEREGLLAHIRSGFISPLMHVNLFGTSSTNIREHFAGDSSRDITFLPMLIRQYMQQNGRYRGWVLGLQGILKKLGTAEIPDANDIQLLRNWYEQERAQGKEPTAEQIARDFSFTEQQLRETFTFTPGSLEDAEQKYGESFRKDLAEITVDEAKLALVVAGIAPNVNIEAAPAQVPAVVVDESDSGPQRIEPNAPPGGIDFNPENLKLEINKQNGGIKVEFDPKILEEIRANGIEGLVPVILNIQRVQNVVPLLSQNANEPQLQATNI